MIGLGAALLVAIEIHAAGNCPAAADVQQRMAPLLETGPSAGAPDVATIKRSVDGSLAVSLDDGDGRSIGERRFPRGANCGDQAETVAVTLAIWEAQIHPEIALRLDRLSSPAAAAAENPPASATVVSRTLAPAAAPTPKAAVFVGASAAADFQSGAWAPAGRLELGFGHAGGRWRAHLAAIGVAPHTADVAPGHARWWRAALSLGADVDVVGSRYFAVVTGAGAVGGLVSISGSGFDVNRATRSTDAGAEWRVRGEWRLGRVRPWLGVSAIGWLRRQSLDLQGTATSSTLPRLEPMLSLGADFVW
jgi:hypothetical protein